MEQLKVQIDQMLNQLKQRNVGQSSADLFKMIGKLEEAKSYLLAQAVRPELHTFGPPPQGFFDNLPAHVAGGQQVVEIPPAAQVGGGQQVVEIPPAAQVGGGQQVIQIPQAAQVGDASRWKYLWDPSDERHFASITNLVPWFTTTLNKEGDKKFLEIGDGHSRDIENGSPPQSFINSAASDFEEFKVG